MLCPGWKRPEIEAISLPQGFKNEDHAGHDFSVGQNPCGLAWEPITSIKKSSVSHHLYTVILAEYPCIMSKPTGCIMMSSVLILQRARLPAPSLQKRCTWSRWPPLDSTLPSVPPAGFVYSKSQPVRFHFILSMHLLREFYFLRCMCTVCRIRWASYNATRLPLPLLSVPLECVWSIRLCNGNRPDTCRQEFKLVTTGGRRTPCYRSLALTRYTKILK